MSTTPVTDIHAHVLAGLDDGPSNLDESLQLLQTFANFGIERVFCTSHYGSPHFDVSQADLDHAFSNLLPSNHNSFQPALSRAAEVRLSPMLVADLRDQTVPTLGSTKYVLIEFPGNEISDANLALVHELTVRGYLPIMAHPERNLAVQRRPDWISELIELGVFLQLTGDCFLKSPSEMLTRDKLAWKILEQGQASLVASDAHNTTSRPPTLIQAYGEIAHRLGQTVVDQLMQNANAVWEGAALEPVPVALKTKKRLLGLF